MSRYSIKIWLTGLVMAMVVAMTSPFDVLAQTKAPVEHVVEITGFKFIPERLTVRVGDTITWKNSDIAPHTATAFDKSWDTGTLKRGEQKSLLITQDFSNSYYCRFHPVMKAGFTITIAE